MNYNEDLNNIYKYIKSLIENTKKRIIQNTNIELINLYWSIGELIIKIQKDASRAEYGSRLLKDLSERLTSEFGKGFTERNLQFMRKFYKIYPISNTLSSKLTWSHYKELIKIKDNNERNFYMNECINLSWDVRTLNKQIKSCLYERILLNSDEKKKELLPVKSNIITSNKDLIKEPYILEFLKLNKDKYKESELEKSILNHLKEFMLELGNGFSYIGSEVRITCDNEDFFIDLVFYNRIVNCFVLIDLKIGRIIHRDMGQMQMYVNYYDKEIKKKEENHTIGLLLGTTKNKVAIKYIIGGCKNIFVSTYKLNFPSKEDLIKIIEREKEKFNS